MKTFLTMLLISLFFIFSCESDEGGTENNSITEDLKNEPHIAKVLDKIDANSYTYLKVTENKKSYWIAVPLMKIETGETIYFSKFMVMKDFKSETLNRTFSSVLFVEDARKSSNPEEMTKVHSGVTSVSKENIKLEPAENGNTVEEIYAERNKLAGKTVTVRGKVVKYNPQIMKKNWIHIQDGSGSDKNYDLVVTSDQTAKVGDVITVKGTLSVDKDFGAGYFFPVIVEEANLE